MRVAVTTANGKLGRAIINGLKTELGSEHVIGVARAPKKAADLGVEVRRGDYDEPAHFESAFSGVEVAVIVSSMAPPDRRIGQHRNAILGAKAAGVRKIVYSSIYGGPGKCRFDAIIKSNRQTEADVRGSGLEWVVGRNGLYLEADLECLDMYAKAGFISNCAGDGRCGYTSRPELGAAYVKMVRDDRLSGGTFTLAGAPIAQRELVELLNRVFGLSLSFKSMSVEDYLTDRVSAHGPYLGEIIAGIYQGIREGVFDVPSDFDTVTGRPHLSAAEIARAFKDGQ